MKRIKKTKPKAAKIAYSTTLKKVDTRTVSNNMATTSNSIHRIQVPAQSQHSYIASTSQHAAKSKTRRKYFLIKIIQIYLCLTFFSLMYGNMYYIIIKQYMLYRSFYT